MYGGAQYSGRKNAWVLPRECFETVGCAVGVFDTTIFDYVARSTPIRSVRNNWTDIHFLVFTRPLQTFPECYCGNQCTGIGVPSTTWMSNFKQCPISPCRWNGLVTSPQSSRLSHFPEKSKSIENTTYLPAVENMVFDHFSPKCSHFKTSKNRLLFSQVNLNSLNVHQEAH